MNFNIKNNLSIEESYQKGLLPQRNKKGLFYFDSSTRSVLKDFELSSENRRILRKTDEFEYTIHDIVNFHYDLETQKRIYGWLKELKWDFPMSSVKKVFTDHIFNKIYVWKKKKEVVGYGLAYQNESICHIGYVFYNPLYFGNNLPIRMVLQAIIESAEKKLNFCYLGREADYKKNMPSVEHYVVDHWEKYGK